MMYLLWRYGRFGVAMLFVCFRPGAVRPAACRQAQVPQLESAGDGADCTMSTVLSRGFFLFRVDVVRVCMRFGRETTSELRRLAGAGLSRELADAAAAAVIRSADAVVETEFLRDITLDQFIVTARDSVRLAWRNGVILRETYEHIRGSLPGWYGALRQRGVRKGDRMFYRIREGRLHTLYLGTEGTRYVDQLDAGEESVRAVLGGYLVEGSEFRKGLLESLFAR